MSATIQVLILDDDDPLQIVASYKPQREKVVVEFVSGIHNLQIEIPVNVANTLGDRVLQEIDRVIPQEVV